MIKIRIYPNKTQKKLIYQTLGACRFIRNRYIASNIESFKQNNGFISGYAFAKAVTQMKKTDELSWLKEASSKALKDAIMTQEKAFKKFFDKVSGFPHFISRKSCIHESYFFIKDGIHLETHNRNIIKIPILGNVRITERSRLPEKKYITSGRVVRNKDKFYVMFVYEIKKRKRKKHNEFGLGIDLGIKNYATATTDIDEGAFIFPNFMLNDAYKKKILQYNDLLRAISHKAEINYWKLLHQWMDSHNGEEPSTKTKNIMKGESYSSNRIKKLRRKASLAYQKIVNYRTNAINQIVSCIVEKINPEYIVIEDLQVSKMLSNQKLDEQTTHKLHRYIQESSFYSFRVKLTSKCEENNIELRIARKYFASSKTCCRCGWKDKFQTLADRTFICKKCGNEMDRDKNASINLVNLPYNAYTIA